MDVSGGELQFCRFSVSQKLLSERLTNHLQLISWLCNCRCTMYIVRKKGNRLPLLDFFLRKICFQTPKTKIPYTCSNWQWLEINQRCVLSILTKKNLCQSGKLGCELGCYIFSATETPHKRIHVVLRISLWCHHILVRTWHCDDLLGTVRKGRPLLIIWMRHEDINQ